VWFVRERRYVALRLVIPRVPSQEERSRRITETPETFLPEIYLRLPASPGMEKHSA